MAIPLVIRKRRVRARFAPAFRGARYGKPNGKVAFHHGQDTYLPGYRRAAEYSPVAGKIVLHGYSSYIGYYLVIDTGAAGVHRFVGLAHMYGPSRKKVGSRIQLGSYLGRAAGPGDKHGVSWTAQHSHWTQGSTMTSVLGTSCIDPLPMIQHAYALATEKGPK